LSAIVHGSVASGEHAQVIAHQQADNLRTGRTRLVEGGDDVVVAVRADDTRSRRQRTRRCQKCAHGFGRAIAGLEGQHQRWSSAVPVAQAIAGGGRRRNAHIAGGAASLTTGSGGVSALLAGVDCAAQNCAAAASEAGERARRTARR
jgi:hypothetical protein